MSITLEGTVAEIMRRVADEHIPLDAYGSFTVVTHEEPMESDYPEPEPDEALAFLKSRLATGRNASLEEARQQEEEWRRFQRAMNDTRRQNGEEPVYREVVGE